MGGQYSIQGFTPRQEENFHQKYNIMYYEELGFSYLTQMEDVY